jgi:4a-hydroxytetrahydrobiopterin dehydratase
VIDTHLMSPQEVDTALANLTGWVRDGAGITATFTMETFPLAIDLVTRAATSAEAANHHPDIDVRWRSVTFRLTTHDVGGVTPRDINLARRIQGHATSLGWVARPH